MEKKYSSYQSCARLNVGLIGLGLMGRGMGLSLLRADYPLYVVANRNRTVIEELCRFGALECATPAQLASEVDVVILCLPSQEVTREVLFGDCGVVKGARCGLTVVECSTLLPSVAIEFQAKLQTRGLGFVDCPVTRGPREAVGGTLNAFMGANDEMHAARASEVVIAFSERIFRFGETGSGYAAKLINNFLSFTNLAAIAEAINTAKMSGLDLKTLIDAIGVSGGASKSLAGYAPWLVNATPPASILTIATALKDVTYYCKHAEHGGTLGPVAEQIKFSWENAVAAGLAEKLTTAYFEKISNDPGL